MGDISSFLKIDYKTKEGKIKIAAIVGAIAVAIIVIIIIISCAKGSSEEGFKQHLPIYWRRKTLPRAFAGKVSDDFYRKKIVQPSPIKQLVQQQLAIQQAQPITKIPDRNISVSVDSGEKVKLGENSQVSIPRQQDSQVMGVLNTTTTASETDEENRIIEQTPIGKGVEIALPQRISQAPINPNSQAVAQAAETKQQTLAEQAQQLSQEQKQQNAESFKREFGSYAVDDYEDYSLNL